VPAFRGAAIKKRRLFGYSETPAVPAPDPVASRRGQRLSARSDRIPGCKRRRTFFVRFFSGLHAFPQVPRSRQRLHRPRSGGFPRRGRPLRPSTQIRVDVPSQLRRRLRRHPLGSAPFEAERVRAAHLQSRRFRSREVRQRPAHLLPLSSGIRVWSRTPALHRSRPPAVTCCQLIKDSGRLITVAMGSVSFDSAKDSRSTCPGTAREVLATSRSRILDRDFTFCAATIGNPHCVIPLPEMTPALAHKLRAAPRGAPEFPAQDQRAVPEGARPRQHPVSKSGSAAPATPSPPAAVPAPPPPSPAGSASWTGISRSTCPVAPSGSPWMRTTRS
jgi:hypothetical protein